MRYFIHLAYHGGNYCGWQPQPGLPTVQLTLEQALSTLLRQPIAIVGCGRTDTGVHASDFYAHFNVDDESIGKGVMENLVFKLNSFLPADIAIFDIFPVKENAHARFDATARTYQYHVSNRRLPFKQGLYSRIYFQPDIELMNTDGATGAARGAGLGAQIYASPTEAFNSLKQLSVVHPETTHRAELVDTYGQWLEHLDKLLPTT